MTYKSETFILNSDDIIGLLIIDFWHYPDGPKESQLNGVSLPYSTYDNLSEIDQGAIVDNQRQGRALKMAQLVQAERENNRSQSVPAGDGPSRRRKATTTKNHHDLQYNAQTIYAYTK